MKRKLGAPPPASLTSPHARPLCEAGAKLPYSGEPPARERLNACFLVDIARYRSKWKSMLHRSIDIGNPLPRLPSHADLK